MRHHRKCITLPFLIILLLNISIKATAQKTMENFKTEWEKVEEFKTQGLPASALAIVEKIYHSATKNRNEPQIIKSLLFKIGLQQHTQENATAKSIDAFQKQVEIANEPVKSILESITAELYWNYFQQERYKLYQRTNTSNFKKEDIATWTIDDFNEKISELYLASINNETLLQKTKLAPFDDIILKGNVRYLRPTLYDLLARRALEYFKNNERNISRPAYAFEITSAKVFAPAKEFVQHHFFTKDSASLHHKALLIFQKLLSLHADDEEVAALIDADLERLAFAKQYAGMPTKDELYINSLKHIYEKYKETPASAQAGFLMAEAISNEAYQANRNNHSAPKYTLVNAKKILDDIIKAYPKSEGGINAKNMITRISHPEINLTTEKINVPGVPFRTLVKYKNFNQLHLRVLVLTPDLKKYLENTQRTQEEFIRLAKEQNIRTWKQPLPHVGDYLSHSVEIKIDPLPVGEYVLLASGDATFSLNENPLAVQYFYVSDISFVNSGEQFFVLNRTTGQPLNEASVKVWNQKYDYNTRENKWQKKALYTTDKNGYFKIAEKRKPNERNLIRLEIDYKKDHLFIDDFLSNYRFSPYVWYSENRTDNDYENQKEFDKENGKIFLFTDRSIYRPGQLVYFKGIGITRGLKTKKTILLQSKDAATITLIDANGQKVDSMNVFFNEFGSFNGKFKLPENKLNGNFKIEMTGYQQSSVRFSVEEYKRPKFYTGFEKVKGGYRVNDTVIVTGFAKAYAGNNINGAQVTYRVVRTARFLYPWMFWRRGYPQVAPLEITHGEITTDTEGNFTIPFAAIPDLSLDKKTNPVFDYKIIADVTDLNGETRSAEIVVPIGYQALVLQINLPQGEVVNIDSLKNISISSTNLSGEIEPIIANIKIYKLNPPDRLIRNRMWEEPDQFILSKKEYIQYFPHDEYKNETKKESWRKDALVFEKKDSISLNSTFSIPPSTLRQGWYVVEVTAKDTYGQEVTDRAYFQVYDKSQNTLPSTQYAWNYGENTVTQPGDTAKIVSGSSAKNVFMIQEILYKTPEFGGVTRGFKGLSSANSQTDSLEAEFHFISLNNNKKTFSFSITEDSRGGFGVNEFFVKDNRFYSISNTIEVPWLNKELEISFSTYRNKTLPGSKEKWKVKITGNKGEKVAAEMLASMYDASLDQFKPHSWQSLNIWPTYNGFNTWQARQNFSTVQSTEKYWREKYIEQKEKNYDKLNYIPDVFYNRIYAEGIVRREISTDIMIAAPALSIKNKFSEESKLVGIQVSDSVTKDENTPQVTIDKSQIQIRKNFNETAFFFPELRTDKEGNIEFSFTMPEALTQWKLMTLAHTKDLASGYTERTIVTQKELMVQPNPPRFLREGDRLNFSAKIVNMGDKEVSGKAEFQLLNASTMNPVDGWFKNIFPVQYFTAAAGQATVVNFPIEIPTNFNNAVVYRIVAKAGSVSDGEEAIIPVVTNRMLVTETKPIPMRGNETKIIDFAKLKESGNSKTLTHYGLTIEYTANPAWYAVQALPYLANFPYECTEQSFNRYYANALAQKIANSSPKIKAVFEKWRTNNSSLKSNLQKNEELKSVLLQETPWVLQAKSEAEQKKHIALLFDMEEMGQELEAALNKLINMQSPNGGFVWFKGGPDNRYITQYIVTGIGHLKKLNAYPASQKDKLNSILEKAIPYLDKMLQKDYEELIKHHEKLNDNHLRHIAIQYLYMRSFFPDYAIAEETKEAYNYYRELSKKYWLSQSKYMQGMIALYLNRTDDKRAARRIIKSLKENSINHPELGMYWKEWDTPGYWWYQAPIESQALMIEAFTEIEDDAKTIGDLKTWLLKNKQTNNWKTTKATAEAVYALLLEGTDWLSEKKNVTIQLGKGILLTNAEAGGTDSSEAGTGYFKKRIDGDKVTPEMGNIKVTVSSPNNQLTNKPINAMPSWGAAYWQYFEDLDKITFAETPLQLSKKLFIETNTDKGPVLTPVNEGNQLQIGDKIKVRIELRVDRDMEYVHMKDMRASCMEPTNVISQFKYQGGLGYYETTKDASTNFFFSYLNKGTYVFEYSLFITHSGNFSNGVTTIQCMYAPEFTAHSEGVRVEIVPNH